MQGDGCLLTQWGESLHNVYQIFTLYTLNIHNFANYTSTKLQKKKKIMKNKGLVGKKKKEW